MLAIKMGCSVNFIKVLLHKGAKPQINQPAPDGQTPLHAAVEQLSLELVELLIAEGAALNSVVTHMNWTPLHQALVKRNEPIALLLIRKGAALTSTDIGGQTPLILALAHKCTKVAWALLDEGVDIHAADKDCWTALLQAASHNLTEFVEYFIKKKANVAVAAKKGWTPFLWALYFNNRDLAIKLLQAGAEFTVKPELRGFDNPAAVQPIFLALGQDDPLLDAGPVLGANLLVTHRYYELKEIDMQKRLLEEIEKGDEARVRELIQWGVRLEGASADMPPPLTAAIKKKNSSMALLLIRKGAPINPSDSQVVPPLIEAFECNLITVAKVLLKEGAFINLKTPNGTTVLHAALKASDLKPARKLLKKIAQLDKNIRHALVNAETSEGITPLIIAAGREVSDSISKKDIAEVVDLLLDVEARVATFTQGNMNPLLAAARANNDMICYRLLELCPDSAKERLVQGATADGSTPLLWAAFHNYAPLVRTLLMAGALPDGARTLRYATAQMRVSTQAIGQSTATIQNFMNLWTPVCWAIKNGNVGMLNDLKFYHATFRMLIDGKPAIHMAAQSPEPGILLSFITYFSPDNKMVPREEIDCIDDQGLTPFDYAMKAGLTTNVVNLIKWGAHRKGTVREGLTALHAAILDKNKEMIQALVTTEGPERYSREKGRYYVENIENDKDLQGRTPLYLAVETEQYDVVELLLDKRVGVDNPDNRVEIDAADAHGRTPLYRAVEANQLKIAQLLLERGANQHKSNNTGESPSALARRLDNKDMVALMAAVALFPKG